MYEVSTCSLLYSHKFTDHLCVVATRNPSTDGMIVINKAGVVYSINVEENSLIPFISASNQIPDNKTLSFKLAQRFHLKGADGVFVQMFNQKMATADYQGAANVARDAPQGLLRNSETINRFKSLPVAPGGPAPILIYFNTLL